MKYIRTVFPFLITLLLWRLSVPFWNPGGILALIPIFFFSFIKPVNWFAPFAALCCFLIDYKCDTLLFWTAVYCIFYAANGFQQFIDLTRGENNELPVFVGFVGIPLFVLAVAGFSGAGLIRAAWLWLWLCALYIPITRVVQND